MTQKYFHLPDYVCAPIQQGDIIGTVELKLAGETIGMVNLIAGQDVSQSSLLYSLSKLQEFFGSLYLRVVLCVSASAPSSMSRGSSSTPSMTAAPPRRSTATAVPATEPCRPASGFSRKSCKKQLTNTLPSGNIYRQSSTAKTV